MTIFNREFISKEEVAEFRDKGILIFPNVLAEASRDAIQQEILESPQVRAYLNHHESARVIGDRPLRLKLIPWTDQGEMSFELLLDSFVHTLLRSLIGPTYHLCHIAVRIALPGSKGVGLHQDNRPENAAHRSRMYLQLMYYPSGASHDDGGLLFVPGSHRILDLGDFAPLGPPIESTTIERLNELYHQQVGHSPVARKLTLLPGTLVCMDARLFHAVGPRPAGSGRPPRILLNHVFKEPGPPHRYTQAIPDHWPRALCESSMVQRRTKDRPVTAGIDEMGRLFEVS